VHRPAGKKKGNQRSKSLKNLQRSMAGVRSPFTSVHSGARVEGRWRLTKTIRASDEDNNYHQQQHQRQLFSNDTARSHIDTVPHQGRTPNVVRMHTLVNIFIISPRHRLTTS
jgi:hypothetical protein